MSEEEHVDWLETQLETIRQIGLEHYLAQQLRVGAPATADEQGRAGAQAVTRMRALAKLPTPTWWPSISTVIVPSGEAAVTRPL